MPRNLKLTDQIVRSVAQQLAEDPTLTISRCAADLGVARSTLRDRLNALRDEPGADVNSDGATMVIDPDEAPDSWTTGAILRAHGLNPDEWTVMRISATRWGDPEAPFHRLKVDAVPTEMVVRPPSIDEIRELVPAAPVEGRLGYDGLPIAIMTDQHAPFYDRGLHQAAVSYLAEYQPSFVLLPGDLFDFESISRHRDRIGASTVNENLIAGCRVLADYRCASPHTHFVLMRGNHDARIEHHLIDNTRLADVAPGGEGLPANHLIRLGMLEELGIEFVDEAWDRAKYAITRKLTGRHGYMTAPTAPRKMLDKHTRSQAQGHSHRMSMTFRTRHDPIDVRGSFECGTMAQIIHGLWYDDEPDWQQGFVTGTTWENGDFALAPALYFPGRLLLPDGQKYETVIDDADYSDGRKVTYTVQDLERWAAAE